MAKRKKKPRREPTPEEIAAILEQILRQREEAAVAVEVDQNRKVAEAADPISEEPPADPNAVEPGERETEFRQRHMVSDALGQYEDQDEGFTS